MIYAFFFLFGVVSVPLFQLLFGSGCIVSGFRNTRVQDVTIKVLKNHSAPWGRLRITLDAKRYRTFRNIMKAYSATEVSPFPYSPTAVLLPKITYVCVIWGKKRRRRVAEEMKVSIRQARLALDFQITEPMPNLPPDTFLLLTSRAFNGNAIALQPPFLWMKFLEWKYKKAVWRSKDMTLGAA